MYRPTEGEYERLTGRAWELAATPQPRNAPPISRQLRRPPVPGSLPQAVRRHMCAHLEPVMSKVPGSYHLTFGKSGKLPLPLARTAPSICVMLDNIQYRAYVGCGRDRTSRGQYGASLGLMRGVPPASTSVGGAHAPVKIPTTDLLSPSFTGASYFTGPCFTRT